MNMNQMKRGSEHAEKGLKKGKLKIKKLLLKGENKSKERDWLNNKHRRFTELGFRLKTETPKGYYKKRWVSPRRGLKERNTEAWRRFPPVGLAHLCRQAGSLAATRQPGQAQASSEKSTNSNHTMGGGLSFMINQSHTAEQSPGKSITRIEKQSKLTRMSD
jgi:hypothetical protein